MSARPDKRNFPHPTLRTDRLCLREPTIEDAPEFHKILTIPSVTQYTNFPDAPTAARSEKFVRWMSKLLGRGKGCAWIITELQSGRLVGAIRIDEIHERSKCGVIGYELDPGFWGKGYMSEALAAVARCAHETFGLNRLEAWTLPGNPASDRVLLKNGFRYEGTLRQKSRFKGAFHDLQMYGRLAGDGPVASARRDSSKK